MRTKTQITTLLALCLAVLASCAADILTNCADIVAYEPSAQDQSPKIQVRGQVLSARYCRNRPHPNCESYYAIEDETGGVLLRAPSTTLFAVGDILDINGHISFVRGIGNSIVANKAVVTGHNDVPLPIATDLAHIKNGNCNYRIVAVSGLVVDATKDELDPRYFWIVIHKDGVHLPLLVPSAGVDEQKVYDLVGREISASGVAHPIGMERRFSSVYVEVSSSGIRTAADADFDVFAAPTLNLSRSPNPLTRYCINGRIIVSYGNNQSFVQTTDGHSVNIRFRHGTQPPQRDTYVRISGLIDSDSFFINLIQAQWRHENNIYAELPSIKVTTPKDMMTNPDGNRQIKAELNGKLIKITGKITGLTSDLIDRRITLIDCNGYTIPVDSTAIPGVMESLAPKTIVSVAGVCKMELNARGTMSEMPRIIGFSIIPRGMDDIAVVHSPPWWTPARFAFAFISLVILCATILIWSIALRRIAEKRGQELFKENVARIGANLRTKERTRLAADLHDMLAQMLTGIAFQIDDGNLELASKMLKSCRDELRNCLWDLRNNTLDIKDMGDAIRLTLRPQTGTTELTIRFNVPRHALSDSTAHAVLMMIRELVTNAVRHGHAHHIRITGAIEKDTLLFSVHDDGIGFDPNHRPGINEGHFGLQGIQERIRRNDGQMHIKSGVGHGTQITISIKRQK